MHCWHGMGHWALKPQATLNKATRLAGEQVKLKQRLRASFFFSLLRFAPGLSVCLSVCLCPLLGSAGTNHGANDRWPATAISAHHTHNAESPPGNLAFVQPLSCIRLVQQMFTCAAVRSSMLWHSSTLL